MTAGASELYAPASAPAGRRRPIAAPQHMQYPLPYSRMTSLMVASFTAVTVGRIGDAVPLVSAFPVAKVLSVLLFLQVFLKAKPTAVKPVIRHGSVIALGVITALAIMSIPVSIWPGGAYGYMKTSYLPMFMYFSVAVLSFVDRRMMHASLVGLGFACWVCAMKLIWQPVQDLNLAVGRHGLASLDPNDSGGLMLLAIPIVLYLGVTAKNMLLKLFWFMVPLFLIVALIKTGSRGAFLGLGAQAVALVTFAPPKKRGLYVAVILVAGALFVGTSSASFRHRIMSIFDSSEDYNYTERDGRIEVWKRGMKFMATHPVLGVGVGQFGTADGMLGGKADLGFGVKYSAAHSSFVQIGAELGVVGLVAFCWALFSSAMGMLQVRKTAFRMLKLGRPEAANDIALSGAMLASLFGVITAAALLSWAFVPMTWFLIAVTVALYARALPDAEPTLKSARAVGRSRVTARVAGAARPLP